MASPIPGGGNPIMPRQPKRRPQLVVDPVPGKKPKQPKLKPKLPGAEVPYPMPGIIDDKVTTQPFPGPSPYTPIKQTKAVGKVYKTY